jgi:hypothetical protein
MLRGENDAALVQFKDSLNLLKKETRKRKIFLPGYEGLFFLFALLKSDDGEDHGAALTFIDMASNDKTPCLPVMDAMRSLFNERLGRVSVLEDSLEISALNYNMVISLFM